MTRYDISKVAPQGGYVAKQCPVRAQNDLLVPAVPIPVPPELQRRFDRGIEFEDSVIAQIKSLHPGAWFADGDTPEARVSSTLEGVARGALVILGGRLPVDEAGRRVGKPDLLVMVEGGGYRAVDVKHHMTKEPVEVGRERASAIVSSLGTLTRESAAGDEAYSLRKREEDALQLAHYQRMLEAAGLAPADGRWGGIIGVEGEVVWYDLDAPLWRTKSSSGRQKQRSTMERYDFEFDFRLDVIAVAQVSRTDPAVDALVVPVRIGECDECPWWDHCRERLEEGSGDVSLLPRIGWSEWRIHQDHDVRDRAALARLDPRTARLVAAGVDVPEMRRLVEDLPPETPIDELSIVVRAKSQLARLQEEGVATFGDLDSLCPLTASYADSTLTSLPEHVDLARAALGPELIYRRRGGVEIDVPRAEIEVDVDMENIEEGVYLWGALVTDRTHGTASSQYTAFATWEPLNPEEETANSLRFWHWLQTLRSNSVAAGLTFRAYCYNAAAENTYLRKLGLSAGILDDVTAFMRSEEWVDMLRVVGDQLITGGGLGLKVIAPVAGFEWDVDLPGGAVSMLRYEQALTAEQLTEREEAQEWLLSYNQGDVEATLAIRDWLEATGPGLVAIEALDAAFPSVALTSQARPAR